MAKPYNPHDATKAILDRASEHLASVRYEVSARWLFYRLYQDGIYTGKNDYGNKFIPMLSKARKEFYGKWRPWTLTDETRVITTQGDGYGDEREWLQAVSRAWCTLDHLRNQPAILVVLYEAQAMEAQFRHYLPNAAILSPFRGDPSIPVKWKLAKLLAKRWREYRVPVYVCYFGDFDEKGLGIEKTAKAEILNWARMNKDGEYLNEGGEYHWVRGGLDEAHVKRYGLPLSIEGKGYQWEALSDAQASEIITEATAGLVDNDQIDATQEREWVITERYQRQFRAAFDLG